MAAMHEGSFNQVLAKFLSDEKVATSEEATEIERVIRLVSLEVSTLGEGSTHRNAGRWWPWRRARAGH